MLLKNKPADKLRNAITYLENKSRLIKIQGTDAKFGASFHDKEFWANYEAIALLRKFRGLLD